MKPNIFQIISTALPLWLPVSGNGADLPLTTRQQTVRPLALPADTRLYTCHDYPPDGRAIAWESWGSSVMPVLN